MDVDIIFKTCIFGDGGVGKTTLTRRYLTGLFSNDTGMTIGVDFHSKIMHLNGDAIQLQIWDFAGEDRFRFMLPNYVMGASCGIFMYDITRWDSLKNIDDWLSIFRENAEKGVPIIMVGGKLDLNDKRSVSVGDAVDMAREKSMDAFLECSARDGMNIDLVFNISVQLMLEYAGLTSKPNQ